MQKSFYKLVFAISLFFNYGNTLIAQNETPECLILSDILSDRKILKVYSETQRPDTFYFIFKNGGKAFNCQPNSWRGSLVYFLTDSHSVEIANKAELYHHYKNKDEYFIVDFLKINGNKYRLEIVQPSNSLQVQVITKRKGKRYKVVAMKEYIL